MWWKVLLLLVVAAGVASCASSPTGRSQMITVSDSEMDRMGRITNEEMKGQLTLSRNRARVMMIQCITEAVLAELGDEQHMPQTWEVTVYAEPEVNAFALPGGYIGVFEGLLEVAENQDQVAAVIGHEIAHVTARHAAERVSRHTATGFAVNVLGGASGSQQTAALLGLGAQVGVLLPFNRTQETEADVLGLRYMARAGFDPNGAVELWRNMGRAGGGSPPRMLSTHPSGADRIRDLQRQLPEVMPLYEEARAAGRRPNCDG